MELTLELVKNSFRFVAFVLIKKESKSHRLSLMRLQPACIHFKLEIYLAISPKC